MSERSLTVIDQKLVPFYDDQILAVRVRDGSVYVPIRPICDLLGIDSAGQRRRIQRDPVMSELCRPCDVITTSQGQPPQVREMFCIPLDHLQGWLFGISADRVRPDLRDRVIRYQKECFRVLADAFGHNVLTAAPDALIDELLAADTPAAQAYRVALALAQLARQQLLHEAQMRAQAARLEDHEARLTRIEDQFATPNRLITPDQAMQLSQAVKTVALALGRRSGRNEYGGVYGELYRRFAITSYKALPAGKFDEALNWLNQWHQSLEGQEPF